MLLHEITGAYACSHLAQCQLWLSRYANVVASVTFAAMSFRVAVAASGGGSNLGALLDAFPPHSGSPVEIALVLGNRPEAGALERARARGVPVQLLADPDSADEWIAALRAASADLLVLAGYLRLVPAGVIAAYAGQVINIHPALLPDFGGPGMYGLRVHRAVLKSGARRSGASVHLVDEAYDRGALLARVFVPVAEGDTPERLAARVLAAEHRLLPAVVAAAARAGQPVPLDDNTVVEMTS